ncbi:hypothetical protein P43SY_011922 [Pythium insidiosum]|uniref:Uncharacterized protein n=1 Tax=Pythium insidiosum TaxID=114742 RepID=A0AAD5LRI8_PYTIN|nr:hypothetical protein P43SY_011922 [Pythium insidiosum]
MSVFADLIASSGVSLNPPNLHLAREELAQRVSDFLDQRVSIDVGQLQVNLLDPVCELVGSALAVPVDDVEADLSRLLLLDRRVDTPVGTRRQALEEVADALRLYSSLRSHYGDYQLEERTLRTLQVTSWFSHFAAALIPLVAELEAQLDSPGIDQGESLDAQGLFALARASAAECRLDVALAEVRRLEGHAAQLQADLEDTQDTLASMTIRERSLLHRMADASTATSASGGMPAGGSRRQLASVQAELDAVRRRHTLSATQLDHVYRFCWEHGASAGDDAESWWRLLRACASDDPALVPSGTRVSACRLANARAGQSAPGPAPSVDGRATGAYSVDALDRVDEHATPHSSPSPARASLKRPGSGSSAPRSAKKKLRLSLPDDDDSVEVVTPTGTPQRKARCSMHALRVAEDDDAAAGSAADEDDDDTGKGPASAGKTSGKTSGGSAKPVLSPVAEAKAALLVAVSPRRRTGSAATPPAPAASGPAPGAADAPAADGDADDPASFVPDPEPTPPAHLVATPMKHGLAGAVYQSTVTVPVAPADEPVTDVVFRRVSYPQPLGTVRSQSRFLPVPDMDTKQRPVVQGLATQKLTQTIFFPNYEHDVLAGAPWDAMWFGRVRHFYLVDPTQLSKAQVDWVFDVFRFMFAFRQALWVRNHWLYFGRTTELGPANIRRATAATEVIKAWRDLERRMPAGMTRMIFHEPAIWTVAAKPCAWVPAPVMPGRTLADQLHQLDREEPIRCYWSQDDETRGRFVEALIPLLIARLDSLGGRCWELPGPWSRADYCPQPLDERTVGTPGVDFYCPGYAPPALPRPLELSAGGLDGEGDGDDEDVDAEAADAGTRVAAVAPSSI